MDTGLVLYIAWGFVFVWSAAWLWAFFRVASDTLVSMINGTFTLRGLSWSAACAVLALIPLWIMVWSWRIFQGYLP